MSEVGPAKNRRFQNFCFKCEEACLWNLRMLTPAPTQAVRQSSEAMMVMGQRNTPWVAFLVALVAKSGRVAGFCAAPPGCAAGRNIGRAVSDSGVSTRQSSTRIVLGSALTDFGELLGDQVASAIVGSPVYPLLINEAKSTMKKSAQVSPPRASGASCQMCSFMIV